MPKFLQTMFENENFPIYLGIIIAILLVTFCIVFLLGKKDQKKIEATQKLKTISLEDKTEDKNLFKEETPEEKVEIDANVINDNNVVSDNLDTLKEDSVNIPNEEVQNKDLFNNYFENKSANFVVDPIDEISDTYMVSKQKEQMPEMVENVYEDDVVVPDYSNITKSIEDELNSIEGLSLISDVKVDNINSNTIDVNQKKNEEIEVLSFEEQMNKKIEMLELEEKEEEKTPLINDLKPQENKFKSSTVFSSVYAPEKEKVQLFEDDEVIELPKLKNETEN